MSFGKIYCRARKLSDDDLARAIFHSCLFFAPYIAYHLSLSVSLYLSLSIFYNGSSSSSSSIYLTEFLSNLILL